MKLILIEAVAHDKEGLGQKVRWQRLDRAGEVLLSLFGVAP
jgi:hypothetical protein